MANRQGLGARIAGGAFEGLEALGGALTQDAMRRRQSQQITVRELLKDYTDKVMKGELEPDQAEHSMTQQGYDVPKGYFHNLQPSAETGLGKIVAGLTKAQSPQEVEGTTAMASEPVVKRLPMRLGKMQSASQPFTPEGSDEPQQTLASTQMQPTSPEFNRLLQIRDEKLNAFPPKEVADVDENGVKRTQFVASRPDQLTGRSFQGEPTPEQAGRNLATRDLTQQRASNEGGLPQLLGEAFNTREGVERGAKVETARQSASATAQAGVDVSTNPKNVQAEARKAAVMADASTRARLIAERSGIPPEIANNFINTTATGRSYAYIPPEIPSAERRVALDTLVTPSDANPKGVKIVNKDQMQALAALDKARADYDALMNRFEGHLSKNAEGRPLSMLQNKIGVYLQTDPELVAALATSFPQIIQNLKANAGAVGRIMQIELEGMKNSIPTANDTWRSALLKQMAEFEMFMHAENAILGHPDAK